MNPVKGNGFLISKKAQNSPEGGVMRTLERAGVIQGGVSRYKPNSFLNAVLRRSMLDHRRHTRHVLPMTEDHFCTFRHLLEQFFPLRFLLLFLTFWITREESDGLDAKPLEAALDLFHGLNRLAQELRASNSYEAPA